MRSRLLPMIIAAASLAVPATAAAGGPGKWTRVTDGNLDNIAQVGGARTADGRLHVLWRTDKGDAIRHTSFSSRGKLLGTTPVVGGWSSVGQPALVTDAARSTLVGFWGSHHDSNDPKDPNGNDTWATLAPGATAWTINPSFSLLATDGSEDSAYKDEMSAARQGATYFQAYGDVVHRGVGPALPAHHLQDLIGGGCCGYNANVAADATSVHAAWYSNATGRNGVWTVAVDPATGAPLSGVRRMPGTTGVTGTLDRTPIVAAGGDYFTAYPGGSPVAGKALVWNTGATKATVVARADEIRAIDIAPATNGRLWAVIAKRNGGKDALVVRRSNKLATKWGAPVKVKLPKGTATVWNVQGIAGAGRLDILAHVDANRSHEATWQTQVQAGLTLKAKPGKLVRGHKTTVTFTVSDAGSPVKGATVRIAGKHGKTGMGGKVKLKVGPFTTKAKAKTARAKAKGYVGVTRRIVIAKK